VPRQGRPRLVLW